MIKKIIRKTNEVGLINLIIGSIKSLYYKKLQKKFNFEPWHISPFELREYAQITAKYINSKSPDFVVDIGCGLGEILKHVKAKERWGLDLSQEGINAGLFLHRNTDIKMQCGSFEHLGSGHTIDYLITLNFMHGSPHEVWQPAYHKICKENDIKHIIVDSVKEGNGCYRLDFTKILPKNYRVCDTFGPLLGERYLYVFEKK